MKKICSLCSLIALACVCGCMTQRPTTVSAEATVAPELPQNSLQVVNPTPYKVFLVDPWNGQTLKDHTEGPLQYSLVARSNDKTTFPDLCPEGAVRTVELEFRAVQDIKIGCIRGQIPKHSKRMRVMLGTNAPGQIVTLNARDFE
jgi:hypothetical protein